MTRWQTRYGLTIAALFLTLVLPVGIAHAQVPDNDTYQTIWSHAGANGDVYDSVEWGGGVVICGNFTHVGATAGERVAFWDGADWSALGDGFNDRVYALAVYGGELYAGGDFTASGATAISGLARWDGAGWQQVGGGVDDGCVEDMTVHDGDLIIAGCFYSVDGGAFDAYGIAGWDGGNWFDLDGGSDGSIYALASFNGHLYATGYFENIGSTWANHLARWDGSAWSGIGSGLTGEFGDPWEAEGTDLAVVDGELIISGSFLNAGGSPADGIAGYTGSSWVYFNDGSYFNNYVPVLGDWGGSILAVLENGEIAQWSGFNWQPFVYTLGQAATITDTAFGLVIGGYFQRVGSVVAQSVALLDLNQNWQPLATGHGMNGDVTCFLNWNGMLVTGGYFTRAGRNSTGHVAGWDGTQWLNFGAGVDVLFGSKVSSLGEFQGDLLIGGAFNGVDGVPTQNIARWDGSVWHPMGGSSVTGVSGFAVRNGELYAAGYFGGVHSLGHWNGATWDPIGTSIDGGVELIFALENYGDDLIMAGNFDSVDGVAAENIARWDGTAWHPLGSGISGSVNAVLEWGGLLYVGGSFLTAGGVTANCIAVWDGSTWSTLGDGFNLRVNALGVLDDEIFATGQFTTADGLPAMHIARWDGASWNAMGSGLDDDGRALGVYDEQLFIGGEFNLAGGLASEHMAGWTSGSSGIPWGEGLAGSTTLSGVPNPTRGETTFHHSLTRGGDVEMRVYDLRGRRVAQQRFSGLARGEQALVWDGLGRSGKRLSTGTYFIQIRSADAVSRHKVVLVR